MSKIYYGLVNQDHAIEYAKAVCEALGGGDKAIRLILETAMQESRLGSFEDKTNYSAGAGLCQSDKKPFIDRQERMQATYSGRKWAKVIEEAFDVDWFSVEWRELEHSPLLSFIDCRLTYKLRPEAIPEEIEGRANYWKKFYNTIAGKGEPEEYIDNALELWHKFDT